MTPTLTELEAQLAGADGPRIRQQAVHTLQELRDRCLPSPNGQPTRPQTPQESLRRKTTLAACNAALQVLQAYRATKPSTHS